MPVQNPCTTTRARSSRFLIAMSAWGAISDPGAAAAEVAVAAEIGIGFSSGPVDGRNQNEGTSRRPIGRQRSIHGRPQNPRGPATPTPSFPSAHIVFDTNPNTRPPPAPPLLPRGGAERLDGLEEFIDDFFDGDAFGLGPVIDEDTVAEGGMGEGLQVFERDMG